MKKYFSTIVFAIICGMFIASCGGGSSGKKLASNDVLGDLPNLLYQRDVTDSIRKAEERAALEKLNPNKKGDWDKAAKIDAKFDARREKEEAAFEAEVAKLKSVLVGKAIPFEMEEGLPYEITSCKIVEVNDGGTLNYEFELKVLDAKAVKAKTNWSNEYYVIGKYLDKDGNEFDGNSSGVKIPKAEDGETFTHVEWFSMPSPAKYANFAKIKFVKPN